MIIQGVSSATAILKRDKDLIQLAYEIHEKNKKDSGSNGTYASKEQEEFAELLFTELAKEKGTDILPHLSCTYDLMRREYKIMLSLPDIFCSITNPVDGDVK